MRALTLRLAAAYALAVAVWMLPYDSPLAFPLQAGAQIVCRILGIDY